MAQRARISDAMRARMQEHGLSFNLPSGRLPVIMEDEITHTVEFPVCDDPECCCYQYEREKIIEETTPRNDDHAAPLSRNPTPMIVLAERWVTVDSS